MLTFILAFLAIWAVPSEKCSVCVFKALPVIFGGLGAGCPFQQEQQAPVPSSRSFPIIDVTFVLSPLPVCLCDYNVGGPYIRTAIYCRDRVFTPEIGQVIISSSNTCTAQ